MESGRARRIAPEAEERIQGGVAAELEQAANRAYADAARLRDVEVAARPDDEEVLRRQAAEDSLRGDFYTLAAEAVRRGLPAPASPRVPRRSARAARRSVA